MNGKITSTTTLSTPKNEKSVVIRRARLTEAYRLGEIAAVTYDDTALTKFLSPYRHKYWSYYLRGFQHRCMARLLTPNNVTFVACEATNPNYPIAYASFGRLGNDESAKRQIESRKSVWLSLLSWAFWAWTKVITFLLPDKSADNNAIEVFSGWGVLEDKAHWELPERKNRWEAQSVVVLEQFQGRGIGKRLMREVIALAEADNVPVGLHASEPGRLMYQSVGFEFLSPFQHNIGDEEGGGIMLYTPRAWREGQEK